MLTQDRLKSVLDYNPETGIFTWKVSNSPKGLKGRDAGSGVNGYIRIGIDRDQYLAHRLAWFYVYGEWPTNQIDHINGDRLDNRIENLRDIERGDNQRNMKLSQRNKIGITGVYWSKTKDKWYVQISINGKRKHLGYCDNLFDACCIRKSAELRYNYHENHGMR